MTLDLLLLFDTEEPEFARGFEMGRLWTLLGADDLELPTDAITLHAENAEMVLRIAERYELVAQSSELGEGWIEVVFSGAEETPA